MNGGSGIEFVCFFSPPGFFRQMKNLFFGGRERKATQPFLFTQLFDGAQRANKSWRKEWTCRPAVGAPLVLSFRFVHSANFMNSRQENSALSLLLCLNGLFGLLFGLLLWAEPLAVPPPITHPIPQTQTKPNSIKLAPAAWSPINFHFIKDWLIPFMQRMAATIFFSSFLPFSKKGMKRKEWFVDGPLLFRLFLLSSFQLNFIK